MPTKDKIVNLSTASELVNTWKTDGEKIVFTNGCFDIVHFCLLYTSDAADD